MIHNKTIEEKYASTHDDLHRLIETLSKVIVGQDELITDLIIGVFSGGHILIEGLPGLGKTHLAKAFAKSLGLSMSRIQCTPDLMPADITGTEMLAHDSQNRQIFNFQKGPIFSSVVLVDEINRATPKTQSALLEAMQEHQVTYSGKLYPLPKPFWVIATQNPIELEGTYPLPEAQLDRFTFKLNIQYPTKAALLNMVDVSLDNEPSEHVKALITADTIQTIMQATQDVIISTSLKEVAVDIVLSTQPNSTTAHTLAKQHFRYGASPRAIQSILRAARIKAVLDSRVHVSFSDIKHVALPALRHRVLLNFNSVMEGTNLDSILKEIITQCQEKI